ncbi:MAG: dUTP diphosphatase [Ruminiclostridium sp.]|nr:dUTP diphosphatase [Ruminiclostridium sp.]
MNIDIKKTRPMARLPMRATDGSAGADLYACIEEDIVIKPGERKLIPTGIAIGIPYGGCGAFIFPRSSVSSKFGISLANCVGVVDSDYRGEIMVPLINHSSEPYTVKNGDRIAQMVIMPVILPDYIVCDELDETPRGKGGFGSTGR